MKKIILIFFLSICIVTYSQEINKNAITENVLNDSLVEKNDEFIKVGIKFGYVKTNINIIENEESISGQIGLVGNIKMSELVQLRIEPTANLIGVNYIDYYEDVDVNSLNYSTSILSVPLLIEYNFSKKLINTHLLFGVGYNYNTKNVFYEELNSKIRFNREYLSLNIGIEHSFKTNFIKISPSIRYSFSFGNKYSYYDTFIPNRLQNQNLLNISYFKTNLLSLAVIIHKI